MELAGLIIGGLGIIATIVSAYLAHKFHNENTQLKKLGELRNWLNTKELNELQKSIWRKFNQNGGVIYDTKIFSISYLPEEEYALEDISEQNLQFTRILTLETKTKRDIARILLGKKDKLNHIEQRIQLYHNYELTEIYMGTNQIIPEPTYNFLINKPRDSQPEAVFAWSKSEQEASVAGFQIFDSKIIGKLMQTHASLLDKCEKINSVADIDKYGQKEYDLIKHRFSLVYSDHPNDYDIFANDQIYNGDLVKLLKERIKELNKEDINLIDIGCGTGIILNELAKEFPKFKLKGIDPSKPMLDIARNRCSKHKNISFEEKGVDDYLKPTEKFDVVISTWGFFNWLEKGNILDNLTAPKGLTIVANNWGADDDFHKLWPEPAIKFFEKRRTGFHESGYKLEYLESTLNLLSDKNTYEAMSLLFGKYTMMENHKDNFKIRIVLATKQN